MKIEHGSASVLVARAAAPAADTLQRPVAQVNAAQVNGGEPRRFTPTIQSALGLLLDASTYARDVEADPWQFSVETSALLRLGLTTNECRWLVAKGFAKHACEITTSDADRRVFQPCANLAIPKGSCFVITERGITCARELQAIAKNHARDQRSPPGSASAPRTSLGNGEPLEETPTWDSDRQQLRVGRIIVKEFKVPAANQEAILAAFQEESWCARIDDPLTPKLNQDSKRRLHDTINSLNRNQKHPLIRFLGDGKGEGVRWDFTKSLTTPAHSNGADSSGR